MNWEFQHSFVTRARRSIAWAFWSDMRNHEEEPGIERIELDGPFETGTVGRTIHTDFTQEWELTEVVDGRRFVMTGLTPDGEGSLSFDWEFEGEGSGTRMTQQTSPPGPKWRITWRCFVKWKPLHRKEWHNSARYWTTLLVILHRISPSDRTSVLTRAVIIR